MAELSREEFARLCGDNKAKLNTYIARKKVVVHGAKGELIDNTNPINKAHQRQRQEFNNQKTETNKLFERIGQSKAVRHGRNNEDGEYADEANSSTPSLEAIDALFIGNQGGRKSSGGEEAERAAAKKYMFMKLKGDAELVATRVEKEKILLAKVAGEVLPTEVAFNAHMIYKQSIVLAFETGIMNIANKFCHIMAAGNMDMYTQITEECRRELDRCVKDAGGESNRELEKMIREFNGVKAPTAKRDSPAP
jgi:hypothetical protein